ncbi:MAG TPA: hypothetical protein DEW35_00345 [Ruminococcaceae bacterium]|nr:hypothetical protein [Oscillospiraceae bacterium]
MRVNRKISVIIISWSVLLFAVLAFLFFYILWIRNAVSDFAVSNAKTELQNKANEAVLKVLSEENTEYGDIAHITRNANQEITGIEIDPKNTNLLKSKILLQINKSIPKEELYTVRIPLGTIILNNIFGGAGPRVPFNSQISSGCNIDFKSDFESVGVNQTRHRIVLDVTLSGVILILGRQKGYTAKTTVIISETIISGQTPQTFAKISK